MADVSAPAPGNPPATSPRPQGPETRDPGASQNARRWAPWLEMPISIAVCFIVLVALVVAAVGAPVLTPHDPTRQALLDRNRPPAWMDGGSANHLLGTDNLGYDIFSRILNGARVSLSIGLIAALIGCTLGSALGLVAGFVRGRLDWLIMLAVDAQLATPFLVIATAAITVFGKGLPIVIVLAGVSGWMLFARATRAVVLSMRESEMVTAARALGANDLRVVLRYILPNVAPVILVIATIDLRRIILFEAGLSFLGLGVPPPQPSWGGMINAGREFLGTAWWISGFPTLALMLTILSVSLIGDWVRDTFDPTARA